MPTMYPSAAFCECVPLPYCFQVTGTHQEIDAAGAIEALTSARKVIIVPGYGMAVSNAQVRMWCSLLVPLLLEALVHILALLRLRLALLWAPHICNRGLLGFVGRGEGASWEVSILLGFFSFFGHSKCVHYWCTQHPFDVHKTLSPRIYCVWCSARSSWHCT